MNFRRARESAARVCDIGVRDEIVDGTEPRYHLLDNVESWRGTDADKEVVRAAFKRWKDIGIGPQFIEVADASGAEIRIGLDHTDGSCSHLGRQVLTRPLIERTMNFGQTLDGWDYGFDMALHEIGHTLGLPHEHQNPNAGIVWLEDAVYNYFGGPPNNWDRETTYHNLLRQ